MGKDKKVLPKRESQRLTTTSPKRDIRHLLRVQGAPSGTVSPLNPSSPARSDMDEAQSPTHSRPGLSPPQTGCDHKHSLEAILQRLEVLPTKQDFLAQEQRLQEWVTSKIDPLKSDITQVAHRLVALEEREETAGSYQARLVETIRSQGQEISHLQTRLDDLDNRGRRNNLRVKGLSEDVPSSGIVDVLTKVFNQALDRDPNNLMVFDRAHRALRPRGGRSDAPRDIICRLHYYTVKEEIIRATRNKGPLEFEGNRLEIYQDLSWHTLQQRRMLRPLTDALRSQDIRYRWGFPLSLSVLHKGNTATIRHPEDLQPFCDVVGIQTPALAEWTQHHRRLLPPDPPLQEVWRTNESRRRRHQPSETPSLSQPSGQPDVPCNAPE